MGGPKFSWFEDHGRLRHPRAPVVGARLRSVSPRRQADLSHTYKVGPLRFAAASEPIQRPNTGLRPCGERCLSAHGIAGVWGTLSCGLFTSHRLAELNGIGDPGLFEGGGIKQLWVQAVGVSAAFATVFVLSFATFYVIKKTVGLRVEEDAGLDISEHGMYGYPEQFIPAPELVGYGATPSVPTAMSAPLASSKEVV